MEPFLTSLIASLTAGAIASTKEVASSAVKDAYVAVKNLLSERYNSLKVERIYEDLKDESAISEVSVSAKNIGLFDDK